MRDGPVQEYQRRRKCTILHLSGEPGLILSRGSEIANKKQDEDMRVYDLTHPSTADPATLARDIAVQDASSHKTAILGAYRSIIGYLKYRQYKHILTSNNHIYIGGSSVHIDSIKPDVQRLCRSEVRSPISPISISTHQPGNRQHHCFATPRFQGLLEYVPPRTHHQYS